MRLALARHDAILRQAVEAWHGQVYKVIGDAMQAAFALPAQALAAALAAQRELTAVAWPTSAPLRVRMWRSKQLKYALINNSLQRGRLSFQVATRRALDYAVGRAGLNVEETTAVARGRASAGRGQEGRISDRRALQWRRGDVAGRAGESCHTL